MPFNTNNEMLNNESVTDVRGIDPQYIRAREDAPEPEWNMGDVWDAAMESENLLVAGSSLINIHTSKDDVSFNATEQDLDEYMESPDELNNLLQSRSQEEFDFRKQRLEELREARSVLASAPWYASIPAIIGASLADPTTFIPGVGIAKAGKGAHSIGKIASKVAVKEGAIEAGREGVLQVDQPTRTIEESVFNVLGAGIVSGLATGAVLKLTSRELKDITQKVTNDIQGPQPSTAYTTKTPDVEVETKTPDVEVETKTPDVEVETKTPDVEVETKTPDVEVETKTRNAADAILDVIRSRSILKKAEAKAEKAGTASEKAEAEIEVINARAAFKKAEAEFEEAKANTEKADQSTVEVPPHEIENFNDMLDSNDSLKHVGLSADAVDMDDLASMAIRGGKVTESFTKGFMPSYLQSASARLATNPLLKARVIGERIMADSIVRNKYFEGKAAPISVSTTVERNTSVYGHKIHEISKNTFNDYVTTTKANGTHAMDIENFERAVGDALRSGDKSPIPEVQKAAEQLRKEVYDPIKKDLIRVGLLPENTEALYADSYFQRIYDIREMTHRKPEFINIIASHFKHKFRIAPEDFKDSFRKNIENAMDDAEIGNLFAEQAEDVWMNIVHTGRGALPRIESEANALQGRVLDIPDEKIMSFLSPYAFHNSNHHIQKTVPLIDFMDEFGDLHLKDELAELADDYNMNFNSLKREDFKSDIAFGKAKEELMRDYEEAKELINAMRDNVLGWDMPIPTVGNRALKRIRQMNFVSKMGGMVISALPDVGRLLQAQHGFGRTIKASYNFLLNSEVKNMNKKNMAMAGIGFENEMLSMPSRIGRLTDTMQDVPPNGRYDFYADKTAQKFTTMSLMPAWNNSMKRLAGGFTVSRAIDVGLQLKKGIREEAGLAFHAQIGLDEDALLRIADEYMLQKSTKLDEAFYIVDVSQFQNITTKNQLLNAVSKSTDQIINTPNMGALPKAFNDPKVSPYIRTILQFKSFAFASTTQTLGYAVGMRNKYVMQTMGAMIAMGSLTAWIKDELAGHAHPETYEEWAYDSLDRSGVLAIPLELNNMLYKATASTGHPVGLQPLLGMEAPRRYRNVNQLGAIAGPSVGLAQDISRTLGGGWKGLHGETPNAGDVSAARRILPFQNLIGVAQLFNEAENRANDALGNRNAKTKRGITNFMDREFTRK